MVGVLVLRVLSEDPWRAEVVERIPAGPDSVFDVFDRVLEKYVGEGYECYDYGSASIQLCVRGDEKIMIGVQLQIPEAEQ